MDASLFQQFLNAYIEAQIQPLTFTLASFLSLILVKSRE